MTAERKRDLVSVDAYLAGELASDVKHEYVDGEVYAIAGASNAHNIIAVNVLACLHSRLRGKPCRPYNSDTKLRIRLQTHWRFYYSDASVICRPKPQEDCFQDEAVVVIEVLSSDTRRIDEGEKKEAYLTMPSLAAYLLIEQQSPLVVVHRRTPQGFVREVYVGLEEVVPLHAQLPLAEVYEGVEFKSEVE